MACFLSNGPGDPEPVEYAIRTISQLLGKRPIFGICLGHQLMALACGAKTFKLKFGHRGANQPVLNLETGSVEITAQNHGFAVEESSLPADLVITHRNLNDQTIAGLRHQRVAGIQRAVPSGSLGRSARQPVPVPAVPRSHEDNGVMQFARVGSSRQAGSRLFGQQIRVGLAGVCHGLDHGRKFGELAQSQQLVDQQRPAALRSELRRRVVMQVERREVDQANCLALLVRDRSAASRVDTDGAVTLSGR